MSRSWEERSEPAGLAERPSVARVYDCLLGGKDHYDVDRAVAARMLRVQPHVVDAVRHNRMFLRHAVEVLVRRGVRQFVDLGAGLPTAENTHQIVQRHAPGSRVVYVDNDPIVLAHGRALLAENDNTTVIHADIAEPGSVLNAPDVARLIDFTEPVAVLAVSVLHFLPDPETVMAAYRRALVGGGAVVLTHLERPGPEHDPYRLLQVVGQYSDQVERIYLRTAEEISRLFGNAEPVVALAPISAALTDVEWTREPLPFLGGIGLLGSSG